MDIEESCLMFFIEHIVDFSKENNVFTLETYEYLKGNFGFLEEEDEEFKSLELERKIMGYFMTIMHMEVSKGITYAEALSILQPLIDNLIEKKYFYSEIVEVTEELFSYFKATELPIKDTSIVSDENIRIRINKIFDSLLTELQTKVFDSYLEEIALPMNIQNQGNYMRNCGISDIVMSHIKLCFLGQIIYQVMGSKELENATITEASTYIDFIESRIEIAIHRLFCGSFI